MQHDEPKAMYIVCHPSVVNALYGMFLAMNHSVATCIDRQRDVVPIVRQELPQNEPCVRM